MQRVRPFYFDGSQAGRRSRITNSLLLPRPLLPAGSTRRDILESVFGRAPRPRSVDLVRHYTVPQQVARRVVTLHGLLRQSIPYRKSDCVRRAERRSVLFAYFTAGRRWGSGSGPDMRGARRTLLS